MKFAQVVFPKRLPRSNDFFDYGVPIEFEKKIKPGVTVNVPFRKSLKTGIVFSVSNYSSIATKKIRLITDIVPQMRLITDHQIQIARWLQKVTGSSLGTIVHTMLPNKPKKQSYTEYVYDTPDSLPTTSNRQEKGYIFHSVSDLNNFVYTHTPKNKTTLIIVPDLSSSQFFSKIPSTSSVLIYDSSLSSTKKFLTWKRVQAGEKHIIVGTRNALLLPFKKLDTIIIVDEANITHQRIDQHPDSDTRDLAKYISKEYQCNLFFTGTSLTVETYAYLTSISSKIIIKKRKSYPHIRLIDSSLFVQKKQSPILPSDLIDFLKKKGVHAFLLYNRKGFYRRIHCTECGWEPHCLSCQSAFISEKNDLGHVECRVCGTTSTIPPTCPQCANPKMYFAYPGIEEIHRRLLQFFPSSEVSLLTKEQNESTSLHRIVLGTLYALPYIDWQTINSTIVLDTDISLDFPDFRSSEWLLQRLQYIYALMQDESSFFIVTQHHEHHTLNAFTKHIPEEWYAHELAERKKMNFPPFTLFIKLTRIDTAKQTGNRIAQNAITQLREFFERQALKGSAISIDPIPARSQRGFHYSILVRVPKNFQMPFEALYNLLGSQWNIKPNPLDLFS